MTSIDLIILGFALVMGLWGYAQGLIVGALSLAGFIGGAVLGSRVGPLILDAGSRSPYAPVAALVGSLLIGGMIASVAEILGFRLRRRVGERYGALDGVGGALLVGLLGLALAWVLGAVALQTPGAVRLREPIQRSLILRELNAVLPPSGPLLRALARFDPLPTISGPSARVRPPDRRIARDPEVRAASRSVVRVIGTACGLGVEGSGWVAGDGIVVTNAHVVAGEQDTTVQVEGRGTGHDAQAIWFDADNDVAILRVGGIEGTPALPISPSAREGTSAAVLGFPENGPYDVRAARLGRTAAISSEDAYGRGPIRRRITSFRGLVRSGNSGGPVVDGDGRVVATVFAAAVASGSGSGFGVPDPIVADALRRASAPVDTGPCSS